MKILMPALHYPPVLGGFEMFSKNIAERVGRTDDVFVVTGRVINVPNFEKKERLKIIRTSLFPLKDLAYSAPLYILNAMIFIFFKSLKLIKKEKIELIHAQGFLSGILSYFLTKFRRIPYGITIQSADFSVYHPKANIKPIKLIYSFIEKKVFKNAIFCHVPSNYLGEYLKKYNTKVFVIPNGVELDLFSPARDKMKLRRELGFNTRNLITACDSRLEYKNATHHVIEAAEYLRKEIEDFKIIIIGDGPERERLEKMIEKLNFKKYVILLGRVLHSEVPKYVSASDIFVRPSLAEGFGISFIQAMAAGVAVIGTPVGGIIDFLKPNETGLFCEPSNPKDIAEKIKILIENEELRNKLIKNAKQMVSEAYDWDKISERIKKIYQNIL